MTVKEKANKTYETCKSIIDAATNAGFSEDQFIPVCGCSINDLIKRMNDADKIR